MYKLDKGERTDNAPGSTQPDESMDVHGFRGGGAKAPPLMDSIAARLLRIIFACYFVVTVLVTCIQLAAEYRHTEARLLQELDAMEKTFGPGITDALWGFNDSVLRGILSGVKELPIVIGVKILDADGKVVMAAGIVQDRDGRRLRADAQGRLAPLEATRTLFDEMLTRTFAIDYTDEKGTHNSIGQWTVYSNQQVIVKQVEYSFFLILINSVIKTFALWFIFLFVVRRWLGRPLQQLSEFVGHLNINNLGDKVFVLKGRERHDELHLLANKLNEMVGNLRNSITENAALYTGLQQENAERRRAEEALRGSQQRVRSIVDNSPTVIYLKDLQGRYILVNRRYEELHHIDGNAIVGKTDYDLFPKEHAAAFQAVDRQVLAAGSAREAEELVPLDDGVHTFISVKFPLDDGSGKPYAVCGISTDITERKRAEEAVRRSEEKYRSIVEEALEGISQISLEGRMLSANPAGASMLGYDSVDDLINTVTDFGRQVNVHPEDRDAIVSTLLEGGVIAGREIELRRKDGRTLWVSISARLVRDGAGRALFIETFTTDVTERKRAEAELKRNQEHLEELVAERTAELTQAKELAEVASQTKSTFLASMSHELRTPLNAILGYAQILKREKNLNERQAVGLNTIQQSGEHLLTLITDLLDLSKIEAGKFDLYASEVNLSAFLQVITDIIRVKAEQKGLSFSYQAASDLPNTVLLDEKRLRQVLLNLLSNAVKFTDQGQVSLRVTNQADGPAKARLRFEVEDSGVGVDADKFEAIFQPFEQVGDVQHRFGGTGLGLSISRQLMRLMNSDIHVSSEPGNGSLFVFELTVEATNASVAVPPAQRNILSYEGPRKKVLVVDDIAANRMMLADLLSALGFDTCEAVDGQQGVEQAQAARPDLILMDIMMPVMNGLDATRSIRRIAGLEQVPIFAISASATPEDQQESMAAGANAFMTKPIDQERLFQLIGSQLGLNWVVEQDMVATDEGGALAVPPAPQIDILYQLALAGNMREIRQQAEQLAALDVRYAPFAGKLSALAKAYQSKAILELVEQYAQNKQAPQQS